MSTEATMRKTITCFLCGGVHFYPGPRFGKHLLNEHGIVFHHEFIVLVSQHKDNHSSLPFIVSDTTKLGHSQFSQTDNFIPISCNKCRNPVDQHQFLASTPGRIRKFDCNNPPKGNKSMNLPSPSSFFSPSKHESPHTGQNNNQEDHSVQEAVPVDQDCALPVRSGFTIKCALCHQVYNDDTTLWNHITRKHGMAYKQYKEEYGTGQTATGTGKFQCLVCQAEVKHMPGCVDKHLKTHGLNWIKYLDWFKENMPREDHNNEVMQGAASSEKVSIEDNYNPEPGMKKSRPLNIRDKINKYCSYCVVTFNTRMMFLHHCQEFHDTKVRNKSGGLMMLNNINIIVEESHELMVERNQVVSSTRNYERAAVTPEGRTIIESSTQPSVGVSASMKRKRSDIATACQYCNKVFSSYSNMERHVRQSCNMKGESSDVRASFLQPQ